MTFKCRLFGCGTYARMLSEVVSLHKQLRKLEPGTIEFSKLAEKLALKDQEKNRHIYLCSPNPTITPRTRKQWEKVYKGH